MSIIDRMRKQSAVYWGPSVPDGDGGFTFPAPVELRVRWEDIEGAVPDPQRQDQVSNTIVYVGQDVEIKGWLWEGALADLPSGTTTPNELDDAHEIKGTKNTPNIKATETLREVYL